MKSRLEAYKDFEKRITSALERAGFKVLANPEIGGLRPDFLVWGPDETTYVIELKSWAPTLRNRLWAIQQAERYREATGSDYAYVVLERLKRSIPSEGLISERDLIHFLTEKATERGARPRQKKMEPPRRQQRTIFAAMPFDPEFDDVFFVAIAEAAKSVSAVAIREDKQEFAGDIVEQIKQDIRGTSAIVADLSESKADVLYEVGFAHALGKPTVHICSTPLSKLPFDVRNVNTMKYTKGQTHRLRGELESRLRAIVPYP
jgi:hypothetical protein